MNKENKRNPIKTLKKHVYWFRTLAFSMLTHVLQFKRFVKKGKQMTIIITVSAFLLLNVLLFNSIGGQLLYSTSMQSSGTIQTIGVAAYRENSCSSVMSSVEWGVVPPGQSNSKVIYLRNEGNSELTLNLNTENWNPSGARDYITLNWDYAGQKILPDQVVQITLTLSVSQSISGIESFYFDIIIVGAS